MTQTYSKFRPTAFDPRGAYLPDRQNWLVLPVMQTRDSGCLDESNFAAALRILVDAGAVEGADCDDDDGHTLEIHRFGHWGPGWFEIIIVHPSLQAAVDEIEASLENYPVLDDGDFSEREWNKASEYWVSLGRYDMRERIRICANAGESIFAARRDEIPENVEIGYLAE